MTVLAASKAATNFSPSSQGDTQGNIEHANQHANGAPIV
jgi:hypothetical protein